MKSSATVISLMSHEPYNQIFKNSKNKIQTQTYLSSGNWEIGKDTILFIFVSCVCLQALHEKNVKTLLILSQRIANYCETEVQ